MMSDEISNGMDREETGHRKKHGGKWSQESEERRWRLDQQELLDGEGEMN
jgi:hypothetical protein